MTTRTPSPQTIRTQAAKAVREYNLNRTPAQAFTEALVHAEVSDAPPATVAMTELPYLVRRLLRIVARDRAIDADRLEAEADFPIRPQADQLVLYGLVTRTHDGQTFTYLITDAGAQCVANETTRKPAQHQPTGVHRHA